MTVLLITTDGKKERINVKSFCEARQYVCGAEHNSPAEIIALSDGTFLLIDEEGKFKNLDINEVATELAHENNSIYPSDFIVGDVIYVDNANEFDELPYE